MYIDGRHRRHLAPVHRGSATNIRTVKLSGKSLGLLINFNVVHLKDGIRRYCKRYRVEVKAINHRKDTKEYTKESSADDVPLRALGCLVVNRGSHGYNGNA